MNMMDIANRRANKTSSIISLFQIDGTSAVGLITGGIFVVCCIFVNNFLTLTNVRALLFSVALVGIAAVGLSFITIVGRVFSLSVTATVAVATVVFAATLHLGAWWALAITVVFGVGVGLVQGLLVGVLKTDPIITSISASAILVGTTQAFTGGRLVRGEGDISAFEGMLFGVIPFQVLAFILIAVTAWWIYRFTVFGRQVLLTGLSERCSVISGTRIWPLVISAFAFSGATAALAGGLLASEAQQGNLQLGGTFGFDAIIAVVVGGISVRGGVGTPLGAAVGALLVGLLSNALVLIGLSYGLQLSLKGLLVIAAVVLTGSTSLSKI